MRNKFLKRETNFKKAKDLFSKDKKQLDNMTVQVIRCIYK